jgi:hypothetical protein
VIGSHECDSIHCDNCLVTGLHKSDSIYCNNCIVIGSDYVVPIVCVKMAADPHVSPFLYDAFHPLIQTQSHTCTGTLLQGQIVKADVLCILLVMGVNKHW